MADYFQKGYDGWANQYRRSDRQNSRAANQTAFFAKTCGTLALSGLMLAMLAGAVSGYNSLGCALRKLTASQVILAQYVAGFHLADWRSPISASDSVGSRNGSGVETVKSAAWLSKPQYDAEGLVLSFLPVHSIPSFHSFQSIPSIHSVWFHSIPFHSIPFHEYPPFFLPCPVEFLHSTQNFFWCRQGRCRHGAASSQYQNHRVILVTGGAKGVTFECALLG